MGASNGQACEEKGRGTAPERTQPLCPVCSGLLVPLRGTYRCARCYFSLCVGCEGLEAPSTLELAD